MIRFSICFAILLPQQALAFCSDLSAMAMQGAEAVIAMPGDASQLANCQTSLAMSGARDVHCSWAFEYRSDAASRSFETLVDLVTGCLGPDAIAATDQSVNHPDAYDLRLFRLNGSEYAVSLKDKGALQQTLVFLRVPAR